MPSLENSLPARINDVWEVKVCSLDVEGVVADEVVDEGANSTPNVADVVTGAEGGVIGNYGRGVESREVSYSERKYLEMKRKCVSCVISS